MAKCPFAIWKPLSGSSGPMADGPYKIVHHTTEGNSASGAFDAFRNHGSDPHFTVDGTQIFQHIDTDEGARALRNAPGGVETNRGGAVQIELVGFAHKRKAPANLINLARLCRWIEDTHQVPREWPAGLPKVAKNGADPGGHNRDPMIWKSRSGHYGHCHVPENTHWDPGYTKEEVAFLMDARFDTAGHLVTAPPPALPSQSDASTRSTMPDHGDVGEHDTPVSVDGAAIPASRPIEVPPAPQQPVRRCNARADTLDFRDRMYEATLVEVPSIIPLENYLVHDVPVLDQGSEGACTGFGLATVAHYLLRRRQYYPDTKYVSPRMFYEMARRYDEWPGEDYDGSSARGAMKGWHKHGVCSREEWCDDAYLDAADSGFDKPRLKGALQRPLGSYFRVNHKDLIAMHAAIAEVGVLYATAVVHEGWQHVGEDGIIEFMDPDIGGHAFAIVAYDHDGFWIQNSWGESWGKKGMGRIGYDDWLKNGTDVWVARLGAAVNLERAASFSTAHSAGAAQSSAYAYSELRPYLVSIGNDGLLRPGGDYGTSAREVATIFERDIPERMEGKAKKRLLLYAHGGLVSEEAAVQRVAEYRAALMEADVYPLAFIWRTDYWTTVTNVLQDSVRRRRPEGVLDQAKDFILDRLDDALEPLARQLTGKAAWDEMKENARLASSQQGAMTVVVRHIKKLRQRYPDLEIHLVGHSAGAILLGPLVQLLTASGTFASGPLQGLEGADLEIASCTLWAPACTTALFKEMYLPAIQSKTLGKFAIYCLNDKAEQDDDCARIYNKSLLYLVSNALEDTPRIPPMEATLPMQRTERALRNTGVPILGMEKFLKSADMQMLFASGQIEQVIAPNDHGKDSLQASRAKTHGSFDDDVFTVTSTFKRILTATQAPPQAVEASNATKAQIGELKFAPSASKMTLQRKDIDYQTRPPH